MKETMCAGGAPMPERMMTRAEILDHAFRLPEDVAERLSMLRESLSTGIETQPSAEKDNPKGVATLESVLNSGAEQIISASTRIKAELFHIYEIVLGNVPTGYSEEAPVEELSSAKLDNIDVAYQLFKHNVTDLKDLKETILGEIVPEASGDVKTAIKTKVSVPDILISLPGHIETLYDEACGYITSMSQALLT